MTDKDIIIRLMWAEIQALKDAVEDKEKVAAIEREYEPHRG